MRGTINVLSLIQTPSHLVLLFDLLLTLLVDEKVCVVLLDDVPLQRLFLLALYAGEGHGFEHLAAGPLVRHGRIPLQRAWPEGFATGSSFEMIRVFLMPQPLWQIFAHFTIDGHIMAAKSAVQILYCA